MRHNLPPGHNARPRPGPPPAPRSAKREFERARRHTARVRFLKRALPVAGILALLAVVGSFFFSRSELPSVGLDNLRFEQGQLVMDSPRLTGVDADKRPFSVSAEKALQDAEKPSLIRLENIAAKLPVSATGFARISAGNGLYDADEKTLHLGGVIQAETDDGLSLRMRDAQIDIETGRLSSANPIELKTDRLSLAANAISVENNGEMIRFTDGVKMTILPFDGGSYPIVPNAQAVGSISGEKKE